MIYFVRHGSTDWNENINEMGKRDPKLQGRADIPLNEKGIGQAFQLAESLKDIKFDRVLCSPLTRTRQTCEIINNGKYPIEIDERLIERDFGEYEGCTRSQCDLKTICHEYSSPKLERAESIQAVKDRVFNLLGQRQCFYGTRMTRILRITTDFYFIVNCQFSIMILRIKIPCWLGIVQASLTLLSLRCGIVN